VFHHGWPLSADDWDNQMMFFGAEGYRVIAHDRRGHGRSTQTDGGNEMDTYAADVTALVEALDLRRFRFATLGQLLQLVRRNLIAYAETLQSGFSVPPASTKAKR